MDWINNPEHPRVQAALARVCDLCKAPAGQRCVNHVSKLTPLADRLVHFGRLEKP